MGYTKSAILEWDATTEDKLVCDGKKHDGMV